MGTPGGPPRGNEPGVPISRGKQRLHIWTSGPRPPWGPPSVSSDILLLNNGSYRQNSGLHFFTDTDTILHNIHHGPIDQYVHISLYQYARMSTHVHTCPHMSTCPHVYTCPPMSTCLPPVPRPSARCASPCTPTPSPRSTRTCTGGGSRTHTARNLRCNKLIETHRFHPRNVMSQDSMFID